MPRGRPQKHFGLVCSFPKLVRQPAWQKRLTNFWTSGASTPIFRSRSCAVRLDLKIQQKICRNRLILKIRSCNTSSDLWNKSARFSGTLNFQWTDVMEFFRGRPRGGDNFTSLFQVLLTLFPQRQIREFQKALETTTAMKRHKTHAPVVAIVELLTCHFTAVGSDFLYFGGCCGCNCYLSIKARWRSRHFTAVTALGPQEVELEHSKVVVSWLLSFHGLFRLPPSKVNCLALRLATP